MANRHGEKENQQIRIKNTKQLSKNNLGNEICVVIYWDEHWASGETSQTRIEIRQRDMKIWISIKIWRNLEI